ncbi:hypothetical protein HaLaN_10889, partial [Haematococcus lacustris]
MYADPVSAPRGGITLLHAAHSADARLTTMQLKARRKVKCPLRGGSMGGVAISSPLFAAVASAAADSNLKLFLAVDGRNSAMGGLFFAFLMLSLFILSSSRLSVGFSPVLKDGLTNTYTLWPIPSSMAQYTQEYAKNEVHQLHPEVLHAIHCNVHCNVQPPVWRAVKGIPPLYREFLASSADLLQPAPLRTCS